LIQERFAPFPPTSVTRTTVGDGHARGMQEPEHSIARHVDLQRELQELAREDRREYVAVRNAILKLAATDTRVGYPWTSAVRGKDGTGLRELRPRAGHSRVRVLFTHQSTLTILLALAPEGGDNPRGFHRAVLTAQHRRSTMLNDEVST
jgi:hypothetical protein